MKTYRNFVNGKYVDAADGRTIPVINPSTEEQYATAPLSASADVDQAMQVAADAFETWRDSTPKDRSLALFRIADAIEARAEELRETYGEEIVEEDTTFAFDSAMIEKYGEVLSMLIENCSDITDADKEKIIKATTKYSVAKGTIDKLNQYGDVTEVMEAVKPVVALKNVEVIKG